jgi:16S rRNA (guanine1207-N2)-methyltransferase
VVRGDRELRFETQPGVFSADGPDQGTLLLLDAIESSVKPHQIVLDLGTGAGVVGIALAPLLSRGEMWMVDVDIRAIRCAERNVDRNHITNAHVILGDVTLDLPKKLRFDLVVANPPTHDGREVLSQFVDQAHHVLKPGGSLWLVVNRLLSVKDLMMVEFGEAEVITKRKGFVILRSTKARRARTAGP